jgi:hypothetical protein
MVLQMLRQILFADSSCCVLRCCWCCAAVRASSGPLHAVKGAAWGAVHNEIKDFTTLLAAKSGERATCSLCGWLGWHQTLNFKLHCKTCCVTPAAGMVRPL